MDRLRGGAPTRDVGMGTGDGDRDSQSVSVMDGGESGFGGGSTSPGTVILRILCRGLWLPPWCREPFAFSLRVMRGGGVSPPSSILPSLARFACGEC